MADFGVALTGVEGGGGGGWVVLDCLGGDEIWRRRSEKRRHIVFGFTLDGFVMMCDDVCVRCTKYGDDAEKKEIVWKICTRKGCGMCQQLIASML